MQIGNVNIHQADSEYGGAPHLHRDTPVMHLQPAHGYDNAPVKCTRRRRNCKVADEMLQPAAIEDKRLEKQPRIDLLMSRVSFGTLSANLRA